MLFQEAPEYEQNFSMVMRVLEYAEVKEEDEVYISPLDLSLIHIYPQEARLCGGDSENLWPECQRHQGHHRRVQGLSLIHIWLLVLPQRQAPGAAPSL